MKYLTDFLPTYVDFPLLVPWLNFFGSGLRSRRQSVVSLLLHLGSKLLQLQDLLVDEDRLNRCLIHVHCDLGYPVPDLPQCVSGPGLDIYLGLLNSFADVRQF